jgi:hypothetical protein
MHFDVWRYISEQSSYLAGDSLLELNDIKEDMCVRTFCGRQRIGIPRFIDMVELWRGKWEFAVW